MKIQPLRMLEQIREKITKTDSPRQRGLLETVYAHVSAELDGRDVERIMATMAPEPRFHWWGMGYGDVGPKGRDAVVEHYSRMTSKRYHLHQHELNRIIVDDNHVFVDGPIHICFPGSVLKEMNIEIDDPDAHYLLSYQSCAVFHFDDEGRCTGEDGYSDGLPVTRDRLKKLRPEEVPDPIEI